MLNKEIRTQNKTMLSMLNLKNKDNKNLFICTTIKDIISVNKFGMIPKYKNWEEEDVEE